MLCKKKYTLNETNLENIGETMDLKLNNEFLVLIILEYKARLVEKVFSQRDDDIGLLKISIFVLLSICPLE